MIEDDAIAAAFGVDEADVTDEMRALVDNALSWVERETQRHFREPEDFVVYFEGGVKKLWLDETPVFDESGNGLLVEEWNSDTSDWDDVVDEGDYQLRASRTPEGRSILVYLVGCWPSSGSCSACPLEHIEVTYSAGYEVGELPGDIEQLVLDIAAARFRVSEDDMEGLKKEMIDGYSYERFGTSEGGVTGLTAEHRATLSKWTHMVMA